MRWRKAMGLAIVPTLCAGCISISYESTGGDLDFKDRFEKSAKEIHGRSLQAEAAALKGHQAHLDPQVEQFVQRHFAKADEIVVTHLSKVRLGLGGFWADEYATQRKVLLDYTLKLKTSLAVVESPVVNATAFPSGKVVLNRPLAEAFTVSADGVDDILLGVLIHEVIHVRDGHALEQWATADSRSAWTRDKVIGALGGLTAIIPFLSVKYDVDYPVTFAAAEELPELSEFAADMAAVVLLERAGYDSKRYVAFLSDTLDATKAQKATWTLLQQRVECLRNAMEYKFPEGIHGIVIGSREHGDQVIGTIDLRAAFKVIPVLDSPEALAKAYPGKPGMSDADRRRRAADEMRYFAFMSCAIRRSFPKAPIEQQVLKTPTFDLRMFSQHLQEARP